MSARADRGAVSPPVGDGDPQRDARLVLGRRRPLRRPGRGRGLRAPMVEAGAAIVDVGGESTRPGADAVSLDEELRRVRAGARAARGRAGLDRHREGRGRATGARARGGARQRRHRAARRPRARRRGRRFGRLPLPDAHAGRAAHDAARPGLRRRGRRGRGLPRGAPARRRRRRRARGADLPRPGHRLRQDGRAQPRAAAPAERARAARPSAPRRRLAQELARSAARRPRGDARHRSPRASARRLRAFEHGASIFRVHDVREHVEALTSPRRWRDDHGRGDRARAARLPRRRGGRAA